MFLTNLAEIEYIYIIPYNLSKIILLTNDLVESYVQKNFFFK